MNVMIIIVTLLVKKLLMVVILLRLMKLNRVIKLLILKLVIESGLPSIKIFLTKVAPTISQEKYL